VSKTVVHRISVRGLAAIHSPIRSPTSFLALTFVTEKTFTRLIGFTGPQNRPPLQDAKRDPIPWPWASSLTLPMRDGGAGKGV
jgi:hypothetical protein